MKIKKLTLFTSNLFEQKRFYTDVLELPKVKCSESSICFRAGHTQLEFVQRKTAKPYHFAFNIPSNKDVEAVKWLRPRVGILKDGGHEIVDFPSWNARAIYFYDTDKNIVELIARKSLNIQSAESFSPRSFLEVSEIGMATENIEEKYHTLNQEFGLTIYDGGFKKFCAIGDEHGLIICIDKNLKDWFPVDDKAYSSDFKMGFDVDGNHFEMAFVDDEIRERTVAH